MLGTHCARERMWRENNVIARTQPLNHIETYYRGDWLPIAVEDIILEPQTAVIKRTELLGRIVPTDEFQAGRREMIESVVLHIKSGKAQSLLRCFHRLQRKNTHFDTKRGTKMMDQRLNGVGMHILA